ncbi:FMN reductase [Xanthomonas populi]|uniref:FMN reductase n=1 Tax=Xanthomonas populi TaxID=53414 RepID=A0A2S7ELU5_9XANT|nr:FMN reductase [Xanthomonas populi]
MPHPLRVVAVSGGLQRPSKAVALTEHLLALIADEVPCEQHLVELGALAPQFAGAVWRSHLPATVEQELSAVEQADVLVVATPVYRGSFTGLFKHFFDFIHQDALIDKPVLLAATGGSERHALVIDHQLRPLFSFFQARTLPLGVYATDRDFLDYCVHNEALAERARLAVQRALPLIELTRHASSIAAEEVAVA